MTPATPNPILAVETHGHATPLGVAANRAGWAWLEQPTPRELLRALFLRSHAVVVVAMGPGMSEPEGAADRLLQAMHTSTQASRVIAAGYDVDDAAERLARRRNVALYLNEPTPHQLFQAAQSLLPQHRPTPTPAPVTDPHPALLNTAITPRVHLAKLMAHPPPARAGPRRDIA